MPDFTFSCPKCQTDILCDESYAGTGIDCPTCTAKLKVPSITATTPSGPAHSTQKVTGPPARNPGKRNKPRTELSEVNLKTPMVVAAGVGLLPTIGLPLFVNFPETLSLFWTLIAVFLFFFGLVLGLITAFMYIFRAFRISKLWGWVLLLPVFFSFLAGAFEGPLSGILIVLSVLGFLGGLVFLVMHWSKIWKLWLTNLGASALMFGSLFIFGFGLMTSLGINLSDGFDEMAFSESAIGGDDSNEYSTPDGTVITVSRGLASGDAGVLWNALPPSYQTDINNLVHDYATAADPKTWARNFALGTRVAAVLASKKEYVFNNPMFASLPDKAAVMKNYDSALNLMNVALKSDLSNLDSLKTLDMGDYLNTTGSKMLGEISTLMDAAPGGAESNPIRDLAKAAVTVVRSDDRTATLSVTIPGQTPQQSEWVKIDNRWLPRAMVDEWSGMMDEARQSVATLKSDPAMSAMQANMIFGMVDGVLAKFENANSQQEFDAAIEGVMGGMMGGVPGGPGMVQYGSPRNFAPEVDDRLLKFHQQQAMSGNANAQYDWGMRYLRGNGLEQDEEQAKHWLTLAANQNFTKAKRELARLERSQN